MSTFIKNKTLLFITFAITQNVRNLDVLSFNIIRADENVQGKKYNKCPNSRP